MAFCKNCGASLNDDAKFCSACGTTVGAAAKDQENADQNTTEQKTGFSTDDLNAKMNDLGAKVGDMMNTADSTGEFDPADIQANKVMAIFAYIGILFLIPMFAAKDSKFARYHTNQGLLLFIVSAAYSFVFSIIAFILLFISPFLGIIVGLLGLVSIVFIVFMVLGIVNVVEGKAKELPIIGKFRILK